MSRSDTAPHRSSVAIEIPVIDPKASIEATLATGGHTFEIRNQIVRPAPEYLVLIERQAPGDQQAEQM